MTDVRAYFHTDIGYFDNPKLADLVEDNPRAVILHLRAIAYCAQHLTDGIFPMRLVMRFACASQCDLDVLVQCGLIRVVDETTAEVHDYLKHQRPARSVKKAKAAGRAGAEARWAKNRDADGNADRIADSNADGNAKRERKKESNTSTVADATPRPDVDRICEHLATSIEGNGSKRPAITQAWQDAARLMLDKDGRTEEQVLKAIDWYQANSFWRTAIFSMPKLREQFDKLRLQAEEEGTGRRGGTHQRPLRKRLPPELEWMANQ